MVRDEVRNFGFDVRAFQKSVWFIYSGVESRERSEPVYHTMRADGNVDDDGNTRASPFERSNTTRDDAVAGGLRRRARGSDAPLVLSDVQLGLVERVVEPNPRESATTDGVKKLVLAAMSMGTGKTLAALATLCVLRARASPRRVRALFVVPKSTLHDAWRKQTSLYTRLARDDVRVVTYSRLRAAFSRGWTREGAGKKSAWRRTTGHRLLEKRRDLVVFDESHTLRNADTILARAARVATSRAKHVLCLTGTPVHNAMSDADEQVRAMGGSVVAEDDPTASVFRDFTERYVYSATTNDAGVDLPEKRSSIVWTDHDFDEREARAYNASLEAVGGGRTVASSTADEPKKNTHHMLALRQLCVEPALFHKHDRKTFDAEARRLTVANPGPKLRVALELVRRLTFEGHAKIVVVSEFVGLLDVFGDLLLERTGEPSVGFDGRLSNAERRRVVREFLEGGTRIMRLSLGAGAYGLSLVPGPTAMIVMDVWYNPAVHRQVESRIHRVGQTRPVVVKTLVTRDSVEAAILDTHDAKEACGSAFFETNDGNDDPDDPDGNEDVPRVRTKKIAEKCHPVAARRDAS